MGIHSRLSAKTLQLGFANAAATYATGKVIGAPIKYPNMVQDPGNSCQLESLTLIDNNAQNGNIDVFFFNQLPTTMGADQATFAISAAESLFCLGVVSVTSYKSMGANAGVSNPQNVVTVLSGTQQQASTQAVAPGSPTTFTPGGKDIWVLLVARASITYTAANSLFVTLGVVQY